MEAQIRNTASTQPVRTCIGCRRTDSRLSLLRIVRERSTTDGTSAVADPLRRLPGRGAWLHPTGECLALALKKRAFGRALVGVVDSTDVQTYIAQLLQAQISQAQAAAYEP